MSKAETASSTCLNPYSRLVHDVLKILHNPCKFVRKKPLKFERLFLCFMNVYSTSIAPTGQESAASLTQSMLSAT